MKLTQTHTCAILDLTVEGYRYIAAALVAAGYEHVFNEDDGRPWIDMSGIGVRASSVREEPENPLDRTVGVSALHLAKLIDDRAKLINQVTELQSRMSEMALERQRAAVDRAIYDRIAKDLILAGWAPPGDHVVST